MPKSLDLQLSWEQIVDRTYEKVQKFIPNEKSFKKWMLAQKDIGYCFDYILYGQLFLLWQRNKKEQDSTIVISGKEGTGKSTLGMLVGSVLDSTFSIIRVSASPQDFINNLTVCQPGQAQQIDEGALSLFSRESMSDGNRLMVKTLMVIRKKSQFLIICIPSFKLLDSYIREHRVSLLLHITKRGSYKAVFGASLKYLSQQLKTHSDISQIRLNPQFFWQGNFRNKLGRVTQEEYAAKKDDHINKFLAGVKNEFAEKEKTEMQMGFTIQQVAKMLHMGRQSVYFHVRHGNIKANKLGKIHIIPRSEVERITSVQEGKKEAKGGVLPGNRT